MPIPLPKLDDRGFDQLVEDAKARARKACPEWTDFSPGDPGTTLVELFAYLTDAMLYRLNRVPPKLRLALLNLAGVTMLPPSAAVAGLVLKRQDGAPSDRAITLPAGTVIASSDGSVEFRLTASSTIDPGQTSIQTTALHCDMVEAEALGKTGGVAGQQFSIARAPVIRPSEDKLDFLFGVELPKGAPTAGLAVRTVGAKTYEIWRETENFADCGEDDPVYQLDRAAGTIVLGPAKGSNIGAGRIPAEAMEVRAWYRCGGGRAGNVAAGMLTTLKGAPPGIEVTNPQRAAGGADSENMEELERRAPSAISSLRIAVTARDYEQVVLNAGGFAKAHAYARSQVWKHADPGVVEIVAMPQIDVAKQSDGAISAAAVAEHRTAKLMDRATAAVDQRRPLGIRTVISWAKVCPVAVSVKVVIGSEADPTTVQAGVARRINALFSPMRDVAFGQQLRASEVYERILGEPGVRYAEELTFRIGEVPDAAVVDLLCDPAQPDCWFATTKTAVHRTLDRAESWSTVHRLSEGQPRFVRRHPDKPGLAALAVVNKGSTEILITDDLGESWQTTRGGVDSEAYDAAWLQRDGRPILLLATGKGLRQFDPASGDGTSVVVVDKAVDTSGVNAVKVWTSTAGVVMVAVSGMAQKGVFMSAASGVSGTYKKVGLEGSSVKNLAIQHTAARSYLWAGLEAAAMARGTGACRLELRSDGSIDPAGFVAYAVQWDGGSCESLAFADNLVIAASNRKGTLVLDPVSPTSGWKLPELNCGLPLMGAERNFAPVEAVSAAYVPDDPATPGGPPQQKLLILAGGDRGVYRSDDANVSYRTASATTFTDRVPLPARWLYCAGDHTVVVAQDRDGRS